jgi:hypothetical protein
MQQPVSWAVVLQCEKLFEVDVLVIIQQESCEEQSMHQARKKRLNQFYRF